MYGPSTNGWKWISFVFIMGCILLALIWLAGPPALLTAVLWLAAPRFGWSDFSYLHIFGASFGVWFGLNFAFVALATYPEWAFWQRQTKKLWDR